MLRAGCITLTVWAILNLGLALSVVSTTVLFGGNSPAIYQILNEEEVAELTAKERTSINSVAAYANGLNAAFGLVAVFVIWYGLHRKLRWAFWCLLFGFLTALLAGIAGDYVLGVVHPEVNIISAIILLFGFFFAAIGLFFRRGTLEAI